MKYGRGLLPPTPEKVAHRLHATQHPDIAARLVSGPPKGQAQLEPCARLDQGRTGTCHAHSAAAACWVAFKAAGRELSFVPSPRYIASCTYADVRAASDPPGQLPRLQDTGAELQDDADAMADWGIVAMAPPTTDGRFSDCENDPPDNTFPEPDPAAVAIGIEEAVSGEYMIPVDAGAPQLVAASLDAGIPVWLGVFVDAAFEELGANDIAQPANQDDPEGGGHALYISGYRTAGDGSFEVRVENSWGTGWADAGAVWASTAWLLSCWQLWPFAVSLEVQKEAAA